MPMCRRFLKVLKDNADGETTDLTTMGSTSEYHIQFNDSSGDGIFGINRTLATSLNPNKTFGIESEKTKSWIVSEFNLVKVIVLVVVVIVLLLSTCKIVFRTFSSYSGSKDEDRD
ncbi:unnamed protein product [Owenia fusiformis]|uniref:Uncharacterized protein n=1 Tax=Owenia fusiformis TaxID=6347 RepID=A0A8J1Y343_OWEFU|nr:unnamed protein product [Owenia fusiformis]